VGIQRQRRIWSLPVDRYLVYVLVSVLVIVTMIVGVVILDRWAGLVVVLGLGLWRLTWLAVLWGLGIRPPARPSSDDREQHVGGTVSDTAPNACGRPCGTARDDARGATTMKLGFFSMNTDFGVGPAEIAVALEERGFHSLWVGEHSHIPTSRATPYPAGGDLPEGYWHMLDPFVSLGMAAAVTSNLRLGTGVCLVLERDLIALAKEVATLDLVSGGRVDFGVGVGWNQEELANHTDIPFRQRYRAIREAIAALRVAWTEEESAFDGEFFSFESSWVYPKPVQKPLPVLFGASGKLGVAHTIEWSDGWAPIDVGFRDLGVGLERFRTQAADAGRDPASIPITMFAWGRPDAEKLNRYRELGIDEVLLGTGGSVGKDMDSTLPVLDEWAALIPDLA